MQFRHHHTAGNIPTGMPSHPVTDREDQSSPNRWIVLPLIDFCPRPSPSRQLNTERESSLDCLRWPDLVKPGPAQDAGRILAFRSGTPRISANSKSITQNRPPVRVVGDVAEERIVVRDTEFVSSGL